MSHVMTVKCLVRDLDALEAAALAKGGELVRGQQTFVSYQATTRRTGACEHAIRIPDAPQGTYEIGLTPRVDGEAGWNLAYDNWGPGHALDAAFGPQLVGLQDEYLAVVAERQLASEGWRTWREQEAGQIVVQAQQY